MPAQYNWETNDSKILSIIGAAKDSVSPATQALYEKTGVLDNPEAPEEAPATPENFYRSMQMAARNTPDPNQRRSILNLGRNVLQSRPESLGGEVGVPESLTNTALKAKYPEMIEKEGEVMPTPIVSTVPGQKPQAGLYSRKGILRTPLGPATIKEEGKPNKPSATDQRAAALDKIKNGEDLTSEDTLALMPYRVAADKEAAARLKNSYDYKLGDEATQAKMLSDMSDRIFKERLYGEIGVKIPSTGPGTNASGSPPATGKKPKILSIKKIQ